MLAVEIVIQGQRLSTLLNWDTFALESNIKLLTGLNMMVIDIETLLNWATFAVIRCTTFHLQQILYFFP